MSQQADIQWIKTELDTIKDPSLIDVFKKLLQYYKKHQTTADWWDTISENEKQLIEKGITQLQNGEGIKHQDVRKKVEKLFNSEK